jgi:hypothetical protein
MKQCTACGEIKPLEQFQKLARNKDSHTNLCKLCKRNYDNNHYKSHPDRRTYIREKSDKRIAQVRSFVWQYLLQHPCIDCGETDPIVLEFDHRSDKEQNIANLIKNGNVARIEKEIAKCDVRCANCHRRKTSNDCGSWRVMGDRC